MAGDHLPQPGRRRRPLPRESHPRQVLNLTWPQVDWRQGILRLPDSKTGKRDVVVSDEVLALLREIADAKGNPKNGRVVCSRTGQKLASLSVTWRRVHKFAGLDDLRLHDLRHSVASDRS